MLVSISFIAPEVENFLSADDLFSQFDQLDGEVFREVATRRTLKVAIDGGYYFAKIHYGVGWREIFKNLFQGKLPVLGAGNEWMALQQLHQIGVPTMHAVAYFRGGSNPATQRSAILTRSLEGTISLEDFETSDIKTKRKLINAVADIANKMHGAGINHRDFYLCHFLLELGGEAAPKLFLIDLHRAQHRHHVPARWLEKDLGGLLFSAFNKNLTRRDLLRFVRTYRGADLRNNLRDDENLWRRVKKRAIGLYLQDHDTLPEYIKTLLAD